MEWKYKVGIMGGTFNPVHNGHLALAAEAYRALNLDKVLFMPSGNSYMKSHVLDAATRVAMLERAVSPYPYFELSTIEVERSGNTYTYETLQSLTQEHPQTRYYFIMGADSLFMIEQWRKPDIIYALSALVCAVRDDYDRSALVCKQQELQQQGAEVILLDMPPIAISSTDVRERVRSGQPISELVPAAVADYILQEHLYVHG